MAQVISLKNHRAFLVVIALAAVFFLSDIWIYKEFVRAWVVRNGCAFTWGIAMPETPDDSTIVIVDPLPLRTVGLMTVLDRLTEANRFRVASMTLDEAEQFVESDSHCSMIIYNVGGASLADHRHARRIKSLRARRKHAAGDLIG